MTETKGRGYHEMKGFLEGKLEVYKEWEKHFTVTNSSSVLEALRKEIKNLEKEIKNLGKKK
jgi:hypothetical protein